MKISVFSLRCYGCIVFFMLARPFIFFIYRISYLCQYLEIKKKHFIFLGTKKISNIKRTGTFLGRFLENLSFLSERERPLWLLYRCYVSIWSYQYEFKPIIFFVYKIASLCRCLGRSLEKGKCISKLFS